MKVEVKRRILSIGPSIYKYETKWLSKLAVGEWVNMWVCCEYESRR